MNLAWQGTARAQGDLEVLDAPGADADEKPWFAGTTESQRQRARTVFLEGNRLIYVPAFAEAAQKYKEALAIWDNPAFHYNLAIAQINLLQPTEAYLSLKAAVRRGPVPLGQDKYERALEYMKSLESQLARVRISSKQAGVEVSMDGKWLFTGPGRYEALVQPGAHQLVASKDGYLTESRQLVGTPGQETKVDIRLRLAQQVLTVRRWAAWKPWAVVAGSALLLGGAAYLDFQTSADFDDFDNSFVTLCSAGCPDDQVPPQLIDDLQSARTRQSISLGTYAVGGALLATGAVLLYLNRERVIRLGDEKDGDGGEGGDGGESGQITWTPVFTPSGAGLGAAIWF